MGLFCLFISSTVRGKIATKFNPTNEMGHSTIANVSYASSPIIVILFEKTGLCHFKTKWSEAKMVIDVAVVNTSEY